jgi:hypothetical protein
MFRYIMVWSRHSKLAHRYARDEHGRFTSVHTSTPPLGSPLPTNKKEEEEAKKKKKETTKDMVDPWISND